MAIAAQVADALAYAHAQGLVHRDIKPANVLLRDEGSDVVRVKVADFGIAKAAATAGGDLTASGTVLGTPKYLAPEQVQGKEPDARADLYSLGVVLFEMLAGRPPFQESTDMATALAQVQQPVPELDELVPGLPRQLTDIVRALLAKDPADRVPSALALAASLARAGRSFGTSEASDEPGAGIHTGSLPTMPSSSEPIEASDRPASAGGTVALAREPTEAAALMDGPTGPIPVQPIGRTAKARSGARKSARARASEKSRARHPVSPRKRRPGRWASIVVVLLLVAGLSLAAALAHVPGTAPGTKQDAGGNGGRASSGSSSASALTVVSVHELTQDGNEPNDNVSELPNVIGNNPSAYWESDIYKSAEFGGSGGFGLVLELDGLHVLHRLTVSTPMQDWTAEVFTSGSDPGALSGWGQPVSRQSAIKGDAVFSLGAKKASWVLFWMVDPGPTRQAVVRRLSVT